MPLQLLINAKYKAASSLLTINVNGTYGMLVINRKTTYAYLKITLVKGIVKPGSPGTVYVTTEIQKQLAVGIAKNGALFQGTQEPENPQGISVSKRISKSALRFGHLIAEIYNDTKSITTSTATIQ